MAMAQLSETLGSAQPDAEESKMINQKRRKRILKLLAEHGTLRLEQLCEWLSASPSTVRRDLAWLAESNLLTRTRGGAEVVNRTRRPFGLTSETFQNNIASFAPQKRAIARCAANMCKDDDSIIINGGTTTYMMAEFLMDAQMKILTNSFLIADQLLRTSENEIFLTGGKVYREQNVILSPFDNDIIQHHYAAKMFIGTFALSMFGAMEAVPLLLQAEKKLLSQTEELIVLADSSKFERRAGLILCGLSRISCVITDTGVTEKTVQWLEQAGVKVVVVAPEAMPRKAGESEHDELA
jgi:DeoR family ulaG and ulaABCDEF operon transcriptional repressor